ncbi:hypothetical protein N7474_009111 [Penicillium riverlandense]|uniref:uncharacterized protein n=1 Tax=Penicillium riverlandense TaxID=1903569 RepID=UPI00254832DF|nr:uncharacterized protein N7474_009111 [Penicillium riverlandense]KAJ5807842.1 hypothetical protein N7474_009111 [Penicillium riverlandense]
MIESFTLPSGREMAYTLSPGASLDRIILLSNSLAEDLTSWDRVVPVLEDQGFRVLRYDQPGHGRSSAPSESKLSSTSFEVLADDVYYLLKHLGISRLHAWVGVSMGGIKAVYFVARHPGMVNKIIVADAIAASPAVTGVADNFAVRISAVKEAGSISEDLFNTRKRWFGEEWMAEHPEEAARMERSMATTTIQGLEACCAALRSPSFDLRPLYPQVGHGCDEALIIAGEKDADLPSKMQEMRKAVEESLWSRGKKGSVRMEIVKSAGHVPYIDGFEDFCVIITKFLS